MGSFPGPAKTIQKREGEEEGMKGFSSCWTPVRPPKGGGLTGVMGNDEKHGRGHYKKRQVK